MHYACSPILLDNSIGPNAITALAHSLKELKGLKVLDLFGKCAIGCRSWATVCNDTWIVTLVGCWHAHT